MVSLAEEWKQGDTATNTAKAHQVARISFV